jgi:RNA polymerase sigma-B factor
VAPGRGSGLYDDVAALFRRYRQTGDRAHRNELVVRYRYLADSAARRFAGRGEPLDDLRQVALLGLVKAVDRFDPDYGVIFPTFALPTVLGELRRHFRQATWPVHVARRTQELHLASSGVRERLAQELGRAPTPAELATAMGVAVEDLLEALEAGSARRTEPIDVTSRLGHDDTARNDDRLLVEAALATLGERERRIVRLRFAEGLTQEEIGRQVGVSQVQVSRLLRSSLDALRSRLGPSFGST